MLLSVVYLTITSVKTNTLHLCVYTGCCFAFHSDSSVPAALIQAASTAGDSLEQLYYISQ